MVHFTSWVTCMKLWKNIKTSDDLQQMDEKELIRLVQKGDVKSFDELVRRYTLFVMKHIRKLNSDEEIMEELFQNVFITVYYKIETYKGEGSFSAWLSTVVSNEWRMYLRNLVKRHFIPNPEEELERMERGARPTMEETMEYREISRAVEEAIGDLPAHYRKVIEKAALEGKSYEMIAEELDLTSGQVKSRLFRARKMLEEMLKDYFEE